MNTTIAQFETTNPLARRFLIGAAAFIPCLFLSYAWAPLHELGHLAAAWLTGNRAFWDSWNTVLLPDAVPGPELLAVCLGGPLLTLIGFSAAAETFRRKPWAARLNYLAFVNLAACLISNRDYLILAPRERQVYLPLLIGLGVLSLCVMRERRLSALRAAGGRPGASVNRAMEPVISRAPLRPFSRPIDPLLWERPLRSPRAAYLPTFSRPRSAPAARPAQRAVPIQRGVPVQRAGRLIQASRVSLGS
jgi:hypothetical protein